MAAAIPIWNGPKGLKEQPDSPATNTDATKTSVTRVYEGDFAACQAAEPSVGQAFSDLPGDVVVVSSTLTHMSGAKGRLTINFETPYQTTFEVEWVEIDKPLIMNPRYWDASTADTTPAGPMPLSLQDKVMIEMWEKEDDFVLKGPSSIGGDGYCFKVLQGETVGTGAAAPIHTDFPVSGYQGNFNIYQLSVKAQDYAAKRLKGEEAYRLWAPVVRQTSEFINQPHVAKCGLIQEPPPEAEAPSGYTWQLSANRRIRTGPYGKYRLNLEWQGAEQIDPDIYGLADPPTAPNPTS